MYIYTSNEKNSLHFRRQKIWCKCLAKTILFIYFITLKRYEVSTDYTGCLYILKNILASAMKAKHRNRVLQLSSYNLL